MSKQITDWEIDATHSTFEFAIRHMRVSTVKGAFSGVSGEIHFDPADVATASIEVEVDMATVDSHNAGRDETLKGERYFNVDTYPTATFKSRVARPNPDGTIQVVGDLTFLGVTREVEFHTVFDGMQMTPAEIWRGAFTARATIDRTDFGLSQAAELPGGGFTQSNEIDLAMFTSFKPKEE